MADLTPVNLSVADVHVAAGLDVPAETDMPVTPAADELDNWQQESYSLDVNAATTLGFPLGNVAANYRRQALLFGVSRWRDVTHNGHSYRFGVALRTVVVISDVKGSMGLTLPVVAAKVELEAARATAQLLVRGYKGAQLAPALPAWQTFNVDSYAQYMKAISDMQKLILEDTTNIVPELLATTVLTAPLPSAPSAVGFVYALHSIQKGRPLYDAIEKISTNDHEAIDALRRTYESIVGDDERAHPDREHIDAAEHQLGGLRIHEGLFGD